MLLLGSCNSSNGEPDPEPEPEPTHRTVLVYIVAANSLGSSGYDFGDIKEMQQAVSEGQMGNGRLLVYHSERNKAPILKEITKNGIDTLAKYSASDVSVSIDQMTRVFRDMKELAPADDYGLVLWSHSQGWLQDGISESSLPMQYSWGSDSGKKMNVTALQKALEGQNFSFIYFDCCYMGTVEVAYQLRNVTPVIAAAPTEVSVYGMPYHLNLKHMFAETPDIMAAAQTTFDYYYSTYNKWDCPLSMSVILTDKLEALAKATKDIYQLAETSWPTGYQPQKYSSESVCYYFDLKHYVKAMAGDRQDLLDAWEVARAQAVPYARCAEWIWGDIEVTCAGGLSTFILPDAASVNTKNYYTLSWYEDVVSAIFN